MCPSPAAFAIGLGPTNPSSIVVAKEPLILRRTGISPVLWLLVPTFLLPHAPARLTSHLHCGEEHSPTNPPTKVGEVPKFGNMLEPRLSTAQLLLVSELLRYL